MLVNKGHYREVELATSQIGAPLGPAAENVRQGDSPTPAVPASAALNRNVLAPRAPWPCRRRSRPLGVSASADHLVWTHGVADPARAAERGVVLNAPPEIDCIVVAAAKIPPPSPYPPFPTWPLVELPPLPPLPPLAVSWESVPQMTVSAVPWE